MYKGGTEYGQLVSFDAGNGFYMIAPKGNLRLASGNSGTSVPSFHIQGGSGSSAGNVLIGDYSAYTPGARLHIKGNGYSSLFKVEGAASSSVVADIRDDGQQFYNSQQFAGSAVQGAFNFDYSPVSNITDGIGTYFKATGNSSSTFKGIHLAVTNTNSSTPTTTGFMVESTCNNAAGGGNNYTFVANCLGTNTNNIAGQFSAVYSNTYANAGISATAENSILNTAINAEANHITYSALSSIGVRARAFGGTTSVGVDA